MITLGFKGLTSSVHPLLGLPCALLPSVKNRCRQISALTKCPKYWSFRLRTPAKSLLGSSAMLSPTDRHHSSVRRHLESRYSILVGSPECPGFTAVHFATGHIRHRINQRLFSCSPSDLSLQRKLNDLTTDLDLLTSWACSWWWPGDHVGDLNQLINSVVLTTADLLASITRLHLHPWQPLCDAGTDITGSVSFCGQRSRLYSYCSVAVPCVLERELLGNRDSI